MSLTRIQTTVTWRSFSGGQDYYFDVIIDEQGQITVTNIRGPVGRLCGSAELPEVVVDDLCAAKGITEMLCGETEIANGTLTYTGQTTQTAAILPGLLNNTNYRVVYGCPCPVQFRTENKTVTSFDAVADTTLGSVGSPLDVTYSVLVATAQTSTTSGTLTFDVGTGSTFDVVFASALSSAQYRVIFSPNDFFWVRAISKTTLGFTVEVGIGFTGAQSVTVGYDVFV